MFADERRTLLIDYLTENQRASVKELSVRLNVSEATLRTDLNLLEEEGLVRRIHGGAVLVEQARPEYAYAERERRHQPEKAAIGRKAAELVQDGQCILVDASTTALELAKHLRKLPYRLTVVTSGIYTALELKENPNMHVILIGGVLRVGSGAVEGTLGEDILNKIKVDCLFTSPAGFQIDGGLMDFNLYEVELKRRMVQASSKVIALMDSSKINVNSIASYADTSRIHTFITDDGAPSDVLDDLRSRNIRVNTVSIEKAGRSV
ncbi:DeoR/GlpR family DNA-binding transcription regulator [Gorillibacterium timonense]|uniref:DeoR/GlpR family DNA-binding transcription regulator n=1 Tax=Gorillibacterium timonense TaxID=1689269 RepID=UPI00071C8990|nr:DeoR/GlpR family DNA-binding transcription regulator [Gorillibacterium timonense]